MITKVIVSRDIESIDISTTHGSTGPAAVQGGEPHTDNTRVGSTLAALQMRMSNAHGSLSKLSECTSESLWWDWTLQLDYCLQCLVGSETELQYPSRSAYGIDVCNSSAHLRSDPINLCQVDSTSLICMAPITPYTQFPMTLWSSDIDDQVYVPHRIVWMLVEWPDQLRCQLLKSH